MEDDYKNCVKWLTDIGVLNATTLKSFKERRDLSLALKDGVALCHLANKIVPGCIESRDFSQNPHTSQFLCLRNARVFLDRCQSYFHISQLFEPADLYYGREIHKIMQTISALSKSEIVRKLNIAAFDFNSSQSSSMVESLLSVYSKNISSNWTSFESNNQTSDTSESSNRFSNTSESSNQISVDEETEYQNDDYDKSIYDDLCSVRISAEIVEGKTPINSKRDMCIKELVVTESKYIEALKIIKVEFMKPLSLIFSASNFKTIFHGIDRLWSIHVDFEVSLKNATLVGGQAIPDCFISSKEKFLYYGEFCSNLPTGQDLLDKLCTGNPVIMQKVRECELAANEGRFKLRDLLAVPMQRILKYHLFLKELVKHTDDNNEKTMLERALEEIHDLSLFINEVKRDNDTLTAMKLVQSSIIDLPIDITLQESGRFILDGEVKIKTISESSAQPRHLFLFDMIILVCKNYKSNDTTYNFKDKIILLYYTAEESLTKEKSSFGINLISKLKDKSYMLIFKKIETRKKWLESLHIAIDNANPSVTHGLVDHEFKMISFGRPTICDVCRKLLRGVFFQGYKCSKTNSVVHKGCISQAKNITAPTADDLPPKPNRGNASPISPKFESFSNKVRAITAYNGIPQPDGGKPILILDLNDVITVVREDSGEWCEGEINGRKGYFPRKNVRSVLNLRSTSYESSQSTVGLHRSASSILPQSTAKTITPNPLQPQEDNKFKDILDNLPWYVGVMSREDASLKLHSAPIGSFLVRLSMADNRKGDYALSIRTDETVRHMRISRSSSGGYFLTPHTTFNTITELVNFYHKNSLEKIFPEVQTTLLFPALNLLLKMDAECEVLFDFLPLAPNQLALTTGDRITLVSKAADIKGWWKGRSMGKEGYFPMNFVKEL